MTLITGIVGSYKNDKCIILFADRALTYHSREFEDDKLIHMQPYPFVIGGSGDVSTIQRCERIINRFLKNKIEDSDEDIATKIDLMLFSKELRNVLCDSSEDGGYAEFLVGTTDQKSSHLYHLLGNGDVRELRNFGCIGLGSSLAGLTILNSVYSPDEIPILDEACRLGVAINIIASILTTSVSSNFNAIALHKGKIGRLKKGSKARLINDANRIVRTWIDLLREIFFLPPDATIDFLLDSDTGKVVKEFGKSKERTNRNLVLAIDDMYEKQKSIYDSINHSLKKHNLDVIFCKSRHEANKMLEKVKDKLRFIILDRRIKHKATTDLAEVAYSTVPGVPTILLSRGIKEGDIEAFLDKGISFHISKEEIENEPQKFEEAIDGLLDEGDYLWEWM
ncbi:MAG: hypothetical protein ACUVQT_10160 [bacterium]